MPPSMTSYNYSGGVYENVSEKFREVEYNWKLTVLWLQRLPQEGIPCRNYWLSASTSPTGANVLE